MSSANGRTTSLQSKPLGIFWDIENMPIPVTKCASGVAKQIRDFMSDRHPECGFAKEFVAVCDAYKMAKQVVKGLAISGVDVNHIDSGAKNAADLKLHELMTKFVDNFGCDCVLVVITSDINFANTIHNARRQNSTTVLIHSTYCSHDLINCVNESYSYEDIIGCVTIPKTITHLSSAYLKVSDLPKDRPLKQIVNRLSQLSANCGGKPDNVCNGMALIRFGCKDDAMRCRQRIAGEDCFGHRINIKLIDDLNVSTKVQDFNICKSVISGLMFDSEDNVTQRVKDMIDEWMDSQISGEFVVNVEVVDERQLVVTAVNPDANQKLLSCAKSHLRPDIDWTEAKDYNSIPGSLEGWLLKHRDVVPDDRMSVIKGLKTRSDEDVTEVVKDLVNEWKDKKINSNIIICVEKNTKQTESDGKCNLFVTTTCAEDTNTLLAAAKRHIPVGSGIKWTSYTHRVHTISGDIERKSVIKGLHTRFDDDFTQLIRNIVDQWDDPSIRSSFVVSVERNTQNMFSNGTINLFVTATNAQTNRILVFGAKKYISDDQTLKWFHYRPKSHVLVRRTESMNSEEMSDSDVSECSYYSNPSSQTSNRSKNTSHIQHNSHTNADKPFGNCAKMSVITGLDTKRGRNLTQIVKKLVNDWKDSKINGNLIDKVESDVKQWAIDGSFRALVTAIDEKSCKALIDGARRYLRPKDGIVWTTFPLNVTQNVTINRNLNQTQCPRLPLLPTPFFWPMVPNVIEVQSLYPFPQYMTPFHNTPPIAMNFKRFPATNVPKPLTTPNVPKPLTAPNVFKCRKEEMVSNSKGQTQSPVPLNQHKSQKTNDLLDKCLSLITGMKTRADDDVTKIVRRMISDWKDSSVNGNFIVSVERERALAKISGKVPLTVKATSAVKCDALVFAAQQHLEPKTGIVWSFCNNNRKESTDTNGKVEANGTSGGIKPSHMFVITGLHTRHTEDCLIFVRQLITDLHLNDTQLSAENIISVTRDCKWKSRDGMAMLFVSAKDEDIKQSFLVFGQKFGVNSGIKFNDYKGFSH